jgi:hypothetical protein
MRMRRIAAGAIVLTAVGFSARLGTGPSASLTYAFGHQVDDRLVVAAPAASTGSCGVERWSVKTGTDADAHLVNTGTASTTSVATMVSWPAQSSPPPNNRISPYETTVWQVSVTLVEYKLESDSDYHLVINDGSGHSMIGEIPDPACVGSSSPFASFIASSRATFDSHYTPNGGFQAANVPVTLTGVGMFDFPHGQTGAAPNQIELHPILSVNFGGPTPPPTPTPTPTPTPPPAGVVNGGFEPGLSGWSTGGVFTPLSSTAQAHSGTHSAQLGSSTTPEPSGDSFITQNVSVASGSPQLSFWYRPSTTDTITYDWQEAQIRTTAGTTRASIFKVASNAQAWQHVTFDMTPYAGQTVQLYFNVHGDGYGDLTWMYLDDVTLSGTPPPTPTPLPTATPTPKPTPTPTPPPTPPPGQQLIVNPGFENGSVAWTGSSGVIGTSSAEPPHSGSYDAWLDGYGATHTDTLAQTVAVPAGVSHATLLFWLHVDTAETTATVAYDTLTVQVLNSSGGVLATLHTYSNLDHVTGYVSHTFELGAYAGQTVTLKFTGSEDSSLQTSFVLDDITLTTS